MGADRWERLAGLAEKPSGRTSVGAGVEGWTDAASLVLDRSMAQADPIAVEPRPLGIPGAADWPGGRVLTTLEPDTHREETIDLDALSPPLLVRAPVPGDRFEPLGMGGRGTPLNDFFRGRRVPRARRVQTPLVCDRLGIVWVVGHRIAHRVRLTENTRRTLGLSWAEHQP